MIKVNWNGRLGNQLFQYAIGRILAEDLGYQLNSGSLNNFSATRDVVDGLVIKNMCNLTGQALDLNFIKNNLGKLGFVINGWFQRYEYYKPHKSKIRAWFNRDLQNPVVKLNKNDVIIHLRRTQANLDCKYHYQIKNGSIWLDDKQMLLNDQILKNVQKLGYNSTGFYAITEIIPFEWYKEILDSITFDNLYLITDCPDDPFLNYFELYKYKLIHHNDLEDFNILRSANRVIMSMSTFSWWGAFLSEAEEIYYPNPNYSCWDKRPREKGVLLLVDDDSRYKIKDVDFLNKTFF